MKMKDKVDTLIVVSNDQLLQIVPENTPLTDAFLVADDILRQGVVGISEIIIKPGLVNVDFADVRTIMGNAGIAMPFLVLSWIRLHRVRNSSPRFAHSAD